MKCHFSSQIGHPSNCSVSTQFGSVIGSYSRHKNDECNRVSRLTYDKLILNYLFDKEYMINWLMEEGLLACQEAMSLVKSTDISDGCKRQCRKQVNGKRHNNVKSIRKDSFFEKSNMSLEEIMKFTYWLTQNLKQTQIKVQLELGTATAVDWDMFCREVCEIVIVEEGKPIGGPGKCVQIDESKIGKCKYHRGHYVEGQWVFGGIDEDSRECFIFPVGKRDQDNLLPIIKQWILPGTTIISDCWKAYTNLNSNGYNHEQCEPFQRVC